MIKKVGKINYRNLSIRRKSTTEQIIFNGNTYYRYPNSRHGSGKYFRRISKPKNIYLHIEVFRSVFGEVPSGCLIHHKDGNILNNDISNLQCMTRGDHMRHHSKDALKAKLATEKKMKVCKSCKKDFRPRGWAACCSQACRKREYKQRKKLKNGQ